jgi:hypothetical protein
MLDPQDLLAIASELKAEGVDGLANEILWLAKSPKITKASFKKNFPVCYQCLNVKIKEVPKHMNDYPTIAKYRLTHGR